MLPIGDLEQGRYRLLQGLCPYCDKGPFRVIAMHTQRAHGVYRRRLREEWDFSPKEPLCDPSWSDERRRIANDHGHEILISSAKPAPKGRKVSARAARKLRAIGFKPGHAPTRQRSDMHGRGTRTEYVRGCRCDECRLAHGTYMQNYKRPIHASASLRHGTYDAYSHGRCRCQLCRAANADRGRQYRAKKRAAYLSPADSANGD